MAHRAFDLIAFDGDDTLWHNERSYRMGRARFHRMLASAGVELGAEDIDAHLNRIETHNLRYYGYGVSSFVLSLIETAIALTSGRVDGGTLHALIELAKDMLTEDVELFAGAGEAVAAMAASHPVMLITKGDLLHQTSKVERSGLRDHFRFIEVVSAKTPVVYGSILANRGVEPGRFLMVGNSVKSDVMPVLELGGWAVHVPAALSWSHEDAAVPDSARSRFVELPAISELPDLVRRWEDLATPSPR